jgi:hypothetical protein
MELTKLLNAPEMDIGGNASKNKKQWRRLNNQLRPCFTTKQRVY